MLTKFTAILSDLIDFSLLASEMAGEFISSLTINPYPGFPGMDISFIQIFSGKCEKFYIKNKNQITSKTKIVRKEI